MWHFPTVSVNGDPAGNLLAFLRKLFSKMQISKVQLAPTGKVRHAVTYRAITVLPFVIDVKNLPRISGAKQVPLNDISDLPISNLTRKVARAALEAAVLTPAKR